jgi:hypothetical protein
MEEAQDRQKGFLMGIASTIIMKGLTNSCASLFEALHNVYLVSMCKFRSMILCMRLTEFLEDVGRGCTHDKVNPLSGPSHSTTTTSNYRLGLCPVGQLWSTLNYLGGLLHFCTCVLLNFGTKFKKRGGVCNIPLLHTLLM